MTVAPAVRVRRDRLTLAAYTWLVGWAFYIYSVGAVLVFLIEGQQISRSVAGLHLLSQAAGALAAGLVSVVVVRRVARRGAMAVASGLICAGLALLAVGAPTWLTVTATFLAGMGGSLGQISVNPLLVDHHGPAGPAVVTEANALAVGGGVLAPLLIGASAAASWGWQPPLILAAVTVVVASTVLLRAPAVAALDVRTPPREEGRRPLPAGTSVALLLVVFVVAAEFCLTSWSVDLVRERLGLSESLAATAGSALLVGMTASRLVASRLALRRSVRVVLSGFLLVAIAGWVVLWAAQSAPAAAVGLVLTGFGVGATFPLALALMIVIAGAESDRVSARLALWLGLAVGGAPFVLGALADVTTLHTAFVVVPLLLLAGLGALQQPVLLRGSQHGCR